MIKRGEKGGTIFKRGDFGASTSEDFVVRISRKSSPNEDLECGCLSNLTIFEFLEPSLWVVLMYVQKEREREVVG